MTNNVKSYLVLSDSNKETKAACCSIVSEKMIEDNPNGFTNESASVIPLKSILDSKSSLPSSTKTCFLTLGCVDESRCLCCIDFDYRHELDAKDVKEHKKGIYKCLRDQNFYIEVTLHGLHVFFLMDTKAHFGDNEHPLKLNDSMLKDVEFMGFNEVKKDGAPKFHGRKILVSPTVVGDGSRYAGCSHKNLIEGLTSLTKCYSPDEIIEIISKCCKKCNVIFSCDTKSTSSKTTNEEALKSYDKKPSFITSTFTDCIKAIENSTIGNRDNTLFICLQKMLEGDVDGIPNTWRDDLELSCRKINFGSVGTAKIHEARFQDIDKNLNLSNHVIKDLLGHPLTPEYERVIKQQLEYTKNENTKNIRVLQLMSTLKNASIPKIEEDKILLYDHLYDSSELEEILLRESGARISLKEIQGFIAKLLTDADKSADETLRGNVNKILCEAQERLTLCKSEGTDHLSRLHEFCSIAGFPVVYEEILILWLSQLFERCLHPESKTKWILVQKGEKRDICKSSFIEALFQVFGFEPVQADENWVKSSSENDNRSLKKIMAFKPFLWFDEFFTDSGTHGDKYKLLADETYVSFRNLYCTTRITKKNLAPLVFNTNHEQPIPANDTSPTRYLVLDYDKTNTSILDVFKTLQKKRGLPQVQKNNVQIAHDIVIDIACDYLERFNGKATLCPEAFFFIRDYQNAVNNTYKYKTEEEVLIRYNIQKICDCLELEVKNGSSNGVLLDQFLDMKLSKKAIYALINGDFDVILSGSIGFEEAFHVAKGVILERYQNTPICIPQKYSISKIRKKLVEMSQNITLQLRPEKAGCVVGCANGTDRNPVSLREIYNYLDVETQSDFYKPLMYNGIKPVSKMTEQELNRFCGIEIEKENNNTPIEIEEPKEIVETSVESHVETHDNVIVFPDGNTQHNGVVIDEYKTEIPDIKTHSKIDNKEYEEECRKWKEKFARELDLPESERYWWRQMEDAPF